MHKFSTVAPKPSALTAFRSLALLVPRFIDTVAFVASATASSSRSDDDAMFGASRRRRDKEIDADPPPPFGLMGVAGDLCVARRRRCPCIVFSLLLDLASQAPSANITISIKRGTERTVQYACGALGRAWRNALRTASSTPRYENLCIIRAGAFPRPLL